MFCSPSPAFFIDFVPDNRNITPRPQFSQLQLQKYRRLPLMSSITTPVSSVSLCTPRDSLLQFLQCHHRQGSPVTDKIESTTKSFPAQSRFDESITKTIILARPVRCWQVSYCITDLANPSFIKFFTSPLSSPLTLLSLPQFYHHFLNEHLCLIKTPKVTCRSLLHAKFIHSGPDYIHSRAYNRYTEAGSFPEQKQCPVLLKLVLTIIKNVLRRFHRSQVKGVCKHKVKQSLQLFSASKTLFADVNVLSTRSLSKNVWSLRQIDDETVPSSLSNTAISKTLFDRIIIGTRDKTKILVQSLMTLEVHQLSHSLIILYQNRLQINLKPLSTLMCLIQALTQKLQKFNWM